MSLPTPPRTTHRDDKENKPFGRVEWSPHNQYHPFSSPSKLHDIRSALVEPPTKSILKRTSLFQSQLPTVVETNLREVTPEPDAPQSDTKYLDSPVATIIDPSSTLQALTEAYSVLGARLRACICESDHPNSSWPLLSPLKEHHVRLMECMTRDVGRALVNPVEGEEELEAKVALPSPANSPTKKGMTAAQVKHARDLCSITHSVLKLLAFVFTQPAIYEIFSDADLRGLLTQVLAIPLALELPTLYARKTCALAIWVIQTQRLSEDVLRPAADRIAYALRRGIDGELGREGKKGSANDGLRAVHDLCVYQPGIFVPAFSTILPSILSSLLAPSLGLRLQACHALGGLAIGSTAIPYSTVHDDLSETVRIYLKTSPRKSPSKSPTVIVDPLIVRTLRQTMAMEDPQNAAQGPIWALSVLGHMAVLLRSALYEDPAVKRIYHSLFTVAKGWRRGCVRYMACLVWRCVIWGFLQPRLAISEEETPSEGAADYCNFLLSFVEAGCGISLVAGVLSGQADVGGSNTLRALVVVEVMLQRNPKTFREGLAVIRRLVKLEAEEEEYVFDSNQLLTPSLFSANPGILTEPFQTPDMTKLLSDMTKEGFMLNDLQPIKRERLSDTRIQSRLFSIWKKSVLQFGKYDYNSVDDLTRTWRVLLDAFFTLAEDEGHSGASAIIEMASSVLRSTLEADIPSSNTPKTSPSSSPQPVLLAKPQNLRIQVVQRCWGTLAPLVKKHDLDVGQNILGCLMKQEPAVDDDAEAFQQWAALCAQVAVVGREEQLHAFWGHQIDSTIPGWEWEWTTATRRMVWKEFSDVWQDLGNSDGIVTLLGVPFQRQNDWDMDEGDFKLWEVLLDAGIGKALDYGLDAVQFVDSVAETLASHFDPTCTSAIRVADILLSSIKPSASDARSVPSCLADFVNETLRTAYPPSPKQAMMCFWTLRSVTDVLQAWPVSLSFDLLDKLQDGLCTWISDENCGFDDTSYESEVLTMYDAVLLCLGQLPRKQSTLEAFQPLVECIFTGRKNKPTAAFNSFNNYWQDTFGETLPSDEWPEQVRIHFGLASPVLVEPTVPEEITEDDEETGDTLEEDNVPADTLPPPPVVCEEVPIRPGSPRPAGDGLFTPPSSPLSTPKRPRRSPQSMFVPRDFASPSRVLLFGSPVAKRRRVSTDNKENMFPAEPVSPTRKRTLPDDLEEGPSSKRNKAIDDELPRRLTFPLSEPPQMIRDVFCQTSSPKKRKRFVMEAVEIQREPTLRRCRSLDDDSSESGGSVPSFTSLLKRDRELASKRPRKNSFVSDYMLRDPTSSSDEPSSDDNPHIGQVTPHHLVSPEVSRRRPMKEVGIDSDELSSDPASDDSIPSPTKQVIKRRKSYTSLNGPYWAGIPML